MSADRLRLFYTASSLVAGDTARIEGEEAAHLARSLRMKPGDRCRIATEEGEEFIAELTAVSPGAAEGKIIERLGRRPPSPLSISLGLPLIKGERFEWVLEKGAELGVDAFIPLQLSRCEVRIPENKAAGRRRRWERIVREAAKQCGRVPPPSVAPPASLEEFMRETDDCDLRLAAWLGEGRRGIGEVLAGAAAARGAKARMTAALLLGPEGDLTEEEAETARAAGFIPVDLGPRVLRADTAPLALCAMVQHVLGDMR